MISNKQLLLLFDLMYLRYMKPGQQWYELTDYLRAKLKDDGIEISYDDKHKDLIYNGRSLRKDLAV